VFDRTVLAQRARTVPHLDQFVAGTLITSGAQGLGHDFVNVIGSNSAR